MEIRIFVIDVATFNGTRRYTVRAYSEAAAEAFAARRGIVLNIVEAE